MTAATTKSTTGFAALFIVDIETGEQIAKISVPAGSTGAPNGLATPAAVDLNGDVNVDYVYAGDLLGNLWKFDLTSTTPGDWKVAYTDGRRSATAVCRQRQREPSSTHYLAPGSRTRTQR